MIVHSLLDSGDNYSNSDDSSLSTHNPGDMPFTSNSSLPASPAIPTDASPVSDSSTRLSAIQTHNHLDPGDNPSNSDNSSLPTRNPEDMPFTSSSSPLASPAIPTNASPVSDSSTRVSAIQTVQTYLTHQAQAIQSHLTTILPGLIQGEVRTQCTQLAQEIGGQISSIREEFNRHTGDQDDPMLEVENRGSSRRGEQSRRNHHRSQQSNNGDEADEENESGDENEISGGTRKYKKLVQALRVSIHSCSP